MANLTVRRNEGGQLASPSTVEWDPFRMMHNLLRWDPFREMAPQWGDSRLATFVPAFDVKETKEGYRFTADMPGVKEDDLEIHLTGNRLTISGKREAEHQDKSETYYAYERTFGTFTRAFTLPEGTEGDKVHAELKNGVLTLLLPKKPELQPRKISLFGSKK